MIRIALVDDHIVTRKGIRAILELKGDIEVMLEATNGQELMEQLMAATILPDIAILDISMPVMNGHETLDRLQTAFPGIKIIVFSLFYEEDTVINMITRGACGYLNKSADPATLADAIMAVHRQGFYLGEMVKKDFFRKKTTGRTKAGFIGSQVFSAREVAFIRLASTNLNYRQIANRMKVQPKTVENYRDNVFRKLVINNRAALTLYAFKTGIIDIFQEK